MRAPARSKQRTKSVGQVAQLVEHMTENHGVGGSIPSLATIPRHCCDHVTFIAEIPSISGCD
jgi:hypothetical protein